MTTVNINASTSYNVHIGNGLLNNLESYIKEFPRCIKIAIISDSNVWHIYGEKVTTSLRAAGKVVYNYVFHAGESSKNCETYLSILNFLAENQLTRGDILVALGGGVVGDITGFAAATYLRGIAFIQIPTTLLAMVDSSVGGKTAIDLPSGKNLVGAFYQPSLVLCDTDVLDTLPDNVFSDGCAEIIKYAMLYNEELFSYLMAVGLAFDKESVISRCVTLKANVVKQDEFDTSARQMLNFGHTIGHGIETHSKFMISHGQAVAIGMSIVTKASVSMGLCDTELYPLLVTLLKKFDLPYSTNFTADQLFYSALSDKKRVADTVNLIVPRAIGECQILPTPISELKSFIEAGL